MKRKEINVGDALYYAEPHAWQNDYSGDRVVVVAVEPYESCNPRISSDGKHYAQTERGNGVLVDKYNAWNDDKPTRTVVQLGYLRGPYAETHAEVERQQAAKRAHVSAHEQQRQQRVTAGQSLVQRLLAAKLISTPYSANLTHDAHSIALSVDVVRLLLDAYERQTAGAGVQQ